MTTTPTTTPTDTVRRVLQRVVLPVDRDTDVLPLYVAAITLREVLALALREAAWGSS